MQPPPLADPTSEAVSGSAADHAPAGPLEGLREQLWALAGEGDRVRVTPDAPDPGWREVEGYLAVPTLARASLLVPDQPGPVLEQAFLAYRRLRPRRVQAQRLLLAAAARARVLRLPRVSVQVPTTDPAPTLPLARLTHVLGGDRLHAAIGIRAGANRKPTLQLFDDAGRARGFAKLAWDPTSAAGVTAESAALWAGPWAGPARVPRMLAAGALDAGPFVVTEPLPASARAVRGNVAAPTPAELGALCPVVGRAPVRETAQFAALVTRCAELRAVRAGTVELLARLHDLLESLERWPVPVPVTVRWHGDLTPWNVARDRDGTLWCWDWESSESDAAAGLDALHWHYGAGRERGERLSARTPARLLSGAEQMLTALGLSAAGRPAIAGLWVATLSERALRLALRRPDSEAWEDAWVRPEELCDLLAAAQQLVSHPRAAR